MSYFEFLAVFWRRPHRLQSGPACDKYIDQFAAGRFISSDPYQASASIGDPASWNRSAYVQNDPVSFNDPSGLLLQNPEEISQDVGYNRWAGGFGTITPYYEGRQVNVRNFDFMQSRKGRTGVGGDSGEGERSFRREGEQHSGLKVNVIGA